MVETHTVWTVDELWEHQQANFSAHMAMMFVYLEEHGLSADEFVQYIGEKAAPGWRECKTPADMLNGILLNVLASGGAVESTQTDADAALAVVTGPLQSNIMQHYGASPGIVDRSWNKYVPIAEALGFRFRWERTDEDTYSIAVGR